MYSIHLNISNTGRSFQQQLQSIHNKAVSFSNLHVQDYDNICYYNAVILNSKILIRLFHLCFMYISFIIIIMLAKRKAFWGHLSLAL